MATQEQPPEEQVGEVRPEPAAFDPSQFTPEQVEQTLGTEHGQQILRRQTQSQVDQEWESRRRRLQREQDETTRRQQRLDRNKRILDGDRSEIEPMLYEEEVERIRGEDYESRALLTANQRVGAELARNFADLPEEDKAFLGDMAARVGTGEVPYDSLVQEALRRHGAHAVRQAQVTAQQNERVVAAEATRAAAVVPRPRPDLGSGGGGGPNWTTQREVEAAFRAGEATLDDVRRARATLEY